MGSHTWSIFDILILNIQENPNWFNIKSKQEKKSQNKKTLKTTKFFFKKSKKFTKVKKIQITNSNKKQRISLLAL